MAQSCDLNEIKKSAVPCEDCLSWLNTNRYFDENTIIFSFEKNEEDNLSIRAQKLYKLLPYKNISTSCEKINIENIEYSKSALLAIEKNKIEESQIIELLNCSFEKYQENNFAKVSNQNIVCSILANNKIYSACKIDWTKRWFVEPFEMASYKAIEENKEYTQIQAVCYFGDEYSRNGDLEFNDGVVSVKSLGRIRQKYANSETLLILNLKNKVLVTTIGGYLPQKFEQGYKII